VESFSERDDTTVVYCKLFRDIVTDSVCVVRSKYVSCRSDFSCKGCIMNIALDRRLC
jgi:hypothetical protein